MWQFHLAAAEMAFRHGRQAVFQFQLSKEQTAVPLSRDYMHLCRSVRERRGRSVAAAEGPEDRPIGENLAPIDKP